MSDRDVTLRYNAEGADAVRAENEAIRESLARVPPTVEALTEALRRQLTINEQLVASNRRVQESARSLTQEWAAARVAFQQGQAAGQGVVGTLGAIGAAASMAATPLSLLALGLGVGIAKMHEFNQTAVETYREMRQLQAISGLSFEEGGALKGAFARAGVNDQAINFALNRLGVEAETDRSAFERMGIEIETAGGKAKNAGQLFLELHDRINQLTDATAKSEARRQFYGRAGAGEIAPIFDLSSKELAGLIEKAREYSNLSPDLVQRLKALALVQAEVADRQREMKLAFAETITVPIEKFLTDVANAARNAGQRVATSGRIAGEYGILGAMMIGPKAAQDLLDSEAAAKRVEDVATRAAEARKKDAEERGSTNDRLSPASARLAESRVRADAELRQRVLQGEAAFLGELSRMRDGNDIQAIEEQMRFTEQTLTIARERYQKLIEIEQRQSPVGAVPSAAQAKLLKELTDVEVAGGEQLKMLALKRNQAIAAEDHRRVTEAIQLEKASSEQRLAIISAFSQQELALLRTRAVSEVTLALEGARIEQQTVERAVAERRRQNDLETQAVAALKERKSALGLDTRNETLQLAKLATERVQMEQDANTKILEARARLVDELDKLARRQADLARGLIDAALNDMTKNGPARMAAQLGPEKTASGKLPTFEEFNRSERERMMREAADTVSQTSIQQSLEEKMRLAFQAFGSFRAGGGISQDEYRNMMEMAGLRNQMAELGTQSPGAQLMKQIEAGLQGRLQKFTPEGVAAVDPGSVQGVLMAPPPMDSVLARLTMPLGTQGPGGNIFGAGPEYGDRPNASGAYGNDAGFGDFNYRSVPGLRGAPPVWQATNQGSPGDVFGGGGGGNVKAMIDKAVETGSEKAAAAFATGLEAYGETLTSKIIAELVNRMGWDATR